MHKYIFTLFTFLLFTGCNDKYDIYESSKLYLDNGKVYVTDTDKLLTGSKVEIWNKYYKIKIVYEDGLETERIEYFPDYSGGGPSDIIANKVEWKNGKQHGKAISFYKSGETECENQYKNGKAYGILKCYYESGELKTTKNWETNVEKKFRKSGKEY